MSPFHIFPYFPHFPYYSISFFPSHNSNTNSSQWNSADARTVNVSAGGGSDATDISTGDAATSGLRGPATKGSAVREEGGADLSAVGREGKDGLGGLPQDAKAR